MFWTYYAEGEVGILKSGVDLGHLDIEVTSLNRARVGLRLKEV
jgi:hypothetical protein